MTKAAYESDWTIEKAQADVPTEPAAIDAEIAYCERRLELLRVAQRNPGPKQEFPRYVYKAAGVPDSPKTPVPVASQVVNSQEELDKLGAGWGDHPATDSKGTATGASGTLDGTVSEVAAYVAGMTDAAALKALKAEERKGKARQGVHDAIDARLAELKEHA